jgi:hypothetical protein
MRYTRLHIRILSLVKHYENTQIAFLSLKMRHPPQQLGDHWRLGIWQPALRFLQGCGQHGGDAPSRALHDPQLGHVPEGSASILPDHAHGAPKTTLAIIRACLVGTHAKNHPSAESAGATDHWELIFSLKLTINCGRNACCFTRTMVVASRLLAPRRIKSSYQQEQRGRRTPQEGRPAFNNEHSVSQVSKGHCQTHALLRWLNAGHQLLSLGIPSLTRDYLDSAWQSTRCSAFPPLHALFLWLVMQKLATYYVWLLAGIRVTSATLSDAFTRKITDGCHGTLWFSTNECCDVFAAQLLVQCAISLHRLSQRLGCDDDIKR